MISRVIRISLFYQNSTCFVSAYFLKHHPKTIFNTKVRSQSLSVLSQEFTTQYTIIASNRDREEQETETTIERINFDYVFEQHEEPVASDLVELKEGN